MEEGSSREPIPIRASATGSAGDELVDITPQKRPFTTSPSSGLLASDVPLFARSVVEKDLNLADQTQKSTSINTSASASTNLINGAAISSLDHTLVASYPTSPRSLYNGSSGLGTINNSGRKGLQNLGNTCFMNSALQCLSATSPLTAYFLRGDWKEELNTTNPLGMEGQIPTVYADLIQNLWLSSSLSSSYAPRQFKETIGMRNPTFVGYGQQDSHELLQSLLDGLHEDLNRILKRTYIADPDYDHTKMTEDEFAKISWESYKKRNDSIIVDLFQGQLKSRTECQTCFKTSIKFDPYMYLQLPIPEPPTMLLTLKVFQTTSFAMDQIGSSIDPRCIPKKGEKINLSDHIEFLEATKKVLDSARIREIAVRVPRNGTIADLKKNVAALMRWDSSHDSICADIWQSKIYKILEDSEAITSISSSDIIYVFPFVSSIEALNTNSILSPFISSTKVEIDELTDEASSDDIIVSSIHFVNTSSHEGLILLPMVLSLPSLITFDPPIPMDDLKEVIGDLLYRLILEKMIPFSSIPLYRRQASGVTLESLGTLSETSEAALNISFFPCSDEWECIPNLCEISVDTDTGPVVIYPVENKESPQPSRSTTGDRESSEVQFALSSPKSDLSDLAHRMERNGSIEGEPDELLEKILPPPIDDDPPLHSYQISRDLKIRVKFSNEVAKMMFNIDRPSYGPSQFLSSNFEPIPDDSLRMRDEQAKPINLAECMAEFTKEELLDGADTMYCSKCKEHRTTKKQLSVYSVPEMLVIHLKRFANSGRYSSRSKLDNFVDAPEKGLDMSQLVSTVNARDGAVYDLYAVSNHFGGLGGDTAYAKNPLDSKWYNCDDSHVSTTDDKIISKAAYLLFYHKRSAKRVNLEQIIKDAGEKLALEMEKKKEEEVEERRKEMEDLESRRAVFLNATSLRRDASSSTLEDANETEAGSISGSFKEDSVLGRVSGDFHDDGREYITEF